jgi:hypothetical protein
MWLLVVLTVEQDSNLCQNPSQGGGIGMHSSCMLLCQMYVVQVCCLLQKQASNDDDIDTCFFL